MTDYQRKADIAWKITLASYLVELIFLALMTLVILPEHKTPNLTIFIILVVPLLPFFYFLCKRSIRAHIGLSYLSLAYFMMAVPSAMDPRYGVIARLELANTILIFIAAMCFARFEQRRLGISVTKPAAEVL